MGEPTTLYRMRDEVGVLLYVGITSQEIPTLRFKQHKAKWWWPLVARQRVDWYGSRNAAKAREPAVIRSGVPVMNKHERTPEQLDEIRPIVLRYWVSVGRHPDDLPPARYWEVS